MATAKPRVKCRKPLGVRGLRKFSRSEMYHKRELWAIRAAYGGSFPRYGPKAAGGGELRKFYSAQA